MPNSKRGKSQFQTVKNVFRYLFAFLACTGLLLSVSLHLIFLLGGNRNKEVEYIAFLAFGLMFLSTYRSSTASFHRWPWYAKIFPILILLYGLWIWFTGPLGALNELPRDVGEIAIQHQAIFMHSIMIGGYVYLCLFWWYANQKQLSRNHA